MKMVKRILIISIILLLIANAVDFAIPFFVEQYSDEYYAHIKSPVGMILLISWGVLVLVYVIINTFEKKSPHI
jgi:hypothetical protein